MKYEKINNPEFVKQISKDTGYAQKDIRAVLDSAATITADNINNNKATAVFKGLIVYPAHYKDITFPRARFGTLFRLNAHYD